MRRLNEEFGVAIVLGEHRLERCLAAADRVVAMEQGRIGFDGAPGHFLEWALDAAPALATGAARMFREAGLAAPASVREGRRLLAGAGISVSASPGPKTEEGGPTDGARSAGNDPIALRARDLWVELGDGSERVDALRGVDLELRPGEVVALMGRNGAGKSTLLRVAAGLLEPTGGRVEAPEGVALLPQRPTDMFVRERVGEELPGAQGAAALELFGLGDLAGANPRDLSGGEGQRLALAIVVGGRGGGSGRPPGAVLLDEPTRGMDRARKEALAALAAELASAGAAVLVATHDVEFAAGLADRVVLMGRGEVVANGPPEELLGGGWYFSTEVARVLDGAAVMPAAGGALIAAARSNTSAGVVRAGDRG